MRITRPFYPSIQPARCYRCHLYGHLHYRCKAPAPICGQCAMPGYAASECKSTDFKCAACGGKGIAIAVTLTVHPASSLAYPPPLTICGCPHSGWSATSDVNRMKYSLSTPRRFIRQKGRRFLGTTVLGFESGVEGLGAYCDVLYYSCAL